MDLIHEHVLEQPCRLQGVHLLVDTLDTRENNALMHIPLRKTRRVNPYVLRSVQR